MVITTIYILLSVILVSLISFIGIITLFINKAKLDKFLLTLVSLSAGTLFGGAFFHLIPQSVESSGGFTVFVSSTILLGIITFFVLNKLIHWKHTHSKKEVIHKSHKGKKSIAYLNLLGDGIHNFLDGLIIAGSYLVSIPTGIATTIAVTIHEAPQEIADFGVLVYSGFTRKKALMFNFLSAALGIVGAIIGIALGVNSLSFIKIILPFTAGAFIYIAGSNLIPELLCDEHKCSNIIRQIVAFVVGILLMYGLLYI